MFKKAVMILLIACFALSATACLSTGKNKLDEVSGEKLVSIEDYLDSASTYFSTPISLDNVKVEEGETSLEAYIKACKKVKDLPEELVDSYVNSFKLMENSANLSDEKIKELAVSVIKEEMIIALVAKNTGLDKVTDEERNTVAEKLALELGCSANDLKKDVYTLDAAVKAEKVEKYLDELLGVTKDDASEESVEDSVAEESTEVSEETTEVSEETTEVSEETTEVQ